ncbi:hypothetical protein CEH05_18580 [Halobacillus halophilus]|nr:hypothetical protein CEH05_18580 [Halobacillus halophilus]
MTGYCGSLYPEIGTEPHGLIPHHAGGVWRGFELLIWQGPEGDDEDSCGINMIGETPESLLEEAQHMGCSTKIATSCGNVERPCVVQGRKANRPPQDLQHNQSSRNRVFHNPAL